MSYKPDRRRVLIGAAALAAPMIGHRRARAAEQIYIGSPGGEYDEIMKRAIDDPFTKATGIQVTRVGVSNGKILAMVRAKDLEIDIADLSSTAVLTLERLGALAPIDYDKWQFAKKSDIAPGLLLTHGAPIYNLAHCMVYNTKAFPAGKRPKTWADAWDVERFPGPRAFPDMAFSQAHFEFALRADGVPKDKLYPLDLDRSLKSFSKIRPKVVKFFTTGALSAQIFTDEEAVVGSTTSGRAQTMVDKGAPVAIEWNDHLLFAECLVVFKDGKNVSAAQKFVDFAGQASAQAAFAKDLKYGPANVKGFELLPPEIAKTMPGHPDTRDLAIHVDLGWWADNRERATDLWNKWMLLG